MYRTEPPTEAAMTVIEFAELLFKNYLCDEGVWAKPPPPHCDFILLTHHSFLPLTSLFWGALWAKWELERYRG